MAALLPAFPKFRAFDSNGAVLAGGLLFTYAAGTTTPLATYTDSTGTVPNTNPVVLDSSGQANVWLTAGNAYKFVLEDQFGVVQWTVDNITGGIQGQAGAAGSVWRNGTGVPSNSIGVDGDYYLNDANGDVYQRSAGAYAKVANILGPAGSSVNRIVNGRFYQSLTPWYANGAVPPTLGSGDAANSGGVQQYAAQSVSVAVTSDGSISQAFSIQALSGTQLLTFNTACWLESVAAMNANSGFVKVYLFDGQNNTETLIGTYNMTATSPTPSWSARSIDVTSYLPVQGDYGLRFELQAYVDNIGGGGGVKGTYTSVDDIKLVTSSAGVAGPTGPQGPQGLPGSSSGVQQRVVISAVGSNTYTTPVSVNYLDVTCVGAGGGGGASSSSGGGGGGGGAVIRRRVQVTPNTAYTVTIGSKGLGSGAGAGTNGANTTFGSLVTAVGGTGGAAGSGSTGGAGGAGGAGSIGASAFVFPATGGALFNGFGASIAGTTGGAGGSSSSGVNGVSSLLSEGSAAGAGGTGNGVGLGGGGGGGSTPFGAGGAGGNFSSSGANAAAGNYGAGGGGAGGGAGVGGNGMDGYCVIEYIG